MIHYAGVTAYNEVQSDTPVAVDNGGSGGTGLTTFLERRVVVAIREVTRRDLHKGGPPSREGTDRGPSDRLPTREAAPSPPARFRGAERPPPQAAPGRGTCGCAPRGSNTLPSGMPSGTSPVRAPPPPPRPPSSASARSPGAPRPSAARRWKSMSVCSVRRDRLSERCPVISGERGRGREERLSAGSVLHVLASGGAACRCRGGGSGGRGWLAAPPGRAVPRGVGLIAWQVNSAGRPGPGRCD